MKVDKNNLNIFLDMLTGFGGSFSPVVPSEAETKKTHTSGRRELRSESRRLSSESASIYVETQSGIQRKDRL